MFKKEYEVYKTSIGYGLRYTTESFGKEDFVWHEAHFEKYPKKLIQELISRGYSRPMYTPPERK